MFENLVEANVELPNSVLAAMLPGLLRDHAQVKARRRGTTHDELIDIYKADIELQEALAKSKAAPFERETQRKFAVAAGKQADANLIRAEARGKPTNPVEVLRSRGIDTEEEFDAFVARTTRGSRIGPPALGEEPLSPEDLNLSRQFSTLLATPGGRRKVVGMLVTGDTKGLAKLFEEPKTDKAVKALFTQMQNSMSGAEGFLFNARQAAKTLTVKFRQARDKMSDEEIEIFKQLLSALSGTLDEKTGTVTIPEQ